MSSPYTLYDLTHITDYFGFEPFSTDLMSLQGHKKIIPLGGSRDKGRDGVLHTSTEDIIFAYSVRNDWRTKLFEDLENVKKNQHVCTRVIFVTNADVSTSEYDTLIQDVKLKYDWNLEIYDIKRIATLVDNHHPELINRYPGLFKLSSSLEKTGDAYTPEKYCNRLLSAKSQINKEYTSLVANHKTIKTFATETNEQDEDKRIPTLEIPEKSSVSFLLGESGAGKSTSLWQIVQIHCNNTIASKESMVPVLIALRNWSTDLKCEQLVFDQFTIQGFDKNSAKTALKKGGFIIIFDGLNEVSDDRDKKSNYDLKEFISRYSKNRYLVSCRSVDFEHVSDVLTNSSKRIEHSAYEISRLSKDQVNEYSLDYLRIKHLDIEKFRDSLQLDNEEQWSDSTSLLQLARIPLFLQIFLETFRESGTLPDSRVDLLKNLVLYLIRREKERGTPFDAIAYEKSLGHIAFRAMSSSNPRQFPIDIALGWLSEQFSRLRESGIINNQVVVSEIWQRILSANLMVEGQYNDVAWLHQLLRDYFLGLHLAFLWSQNPPSNDEIVQKASAPASSLAIAVAISRLSNNQSALIFKTLADSTYRLAWHVFQAQSSAKRGALADEMIAIAHDHDDIETNELMSIVMNLPYVEIVDALDNAYYNYDVEDKRVQIVEALAVFMEQHQPVVENPVNEYRYRPPSEKTLFEAMTKSVNRCADILYRYTKKDIDSVKFYAAKGRYETDRQGCVDQLKELLENGDQKSKNLVVALAEEWGIG